MGILHKAGSIAGTNLGNRPAERLTDGRGVDHVIELNASPLPCHSFKGGCSMYFIRADPLSDVPLREVPHDIVDATGEFT